MSVLAYAWSRKKAYAAPMMLTVSKRPLSRRTSEARAGIWILHQIGFTYWFIGELLGIGASRAGEISRQFERSDNNWCRFIQDNDDWRDCRRSREYQEQHLFEVALVRRFRCWRA